MYKTLLLLMLLAGCTTYSREDPFAEIRFHPFWGQDLSLFNGTDFADCPAMYEEMVTNLTARNWTAERSTFPVAFEECEGLFGRELCEGRKDYMSVPEVTARLRYSACVYHAAVTHGIPSCEAFPRGTFPTLVCFAAPRYCWVENWTYYEHCINKVPVDHTVFWI